MFPPYTFDDKQAKNLFKAAGGGMISRPLLDCEPFLLMK